MWLILACTQPPPSDARAFTEALGGSPADCEVVVDARLRGHCQVANGAPCDSVEPGPWQDECFFVEAEATGGDRGVQTCTRAGPYASECLTHLFKAQVGMDLADAEALQIHFDGLGVENWEPPWGWWWRQHHRRQERVDARCPNLDGPQTRRCVREAVPAIRLAYRSALAERPRELCGVDLEALRDGSIRWVADPALDAAVREELTAACTP